MKEEINCSIDDVILFDDSFDIYNNWTLQEGHSTVYPPGPYLPIEIDLSDSLGNGNISEYYGNYYLKIEVNTNNYYYANNTVNFTLAEYHIEMDTWIYPEGLNQYSWFTDPALSDSDMDGWSDDYEIFTKGTNPLSEDSDGDSAIDSDDRDPLKDLIIEIKFTDGEHNNIGDENPILQGTVEFNTHNQELYFATPTEKSDEGDVDFGQTYYFNVEDSKTIQGNEITFNGELWHKYPEDDDGNTLGDIKILDENCHYTINSGIDEDTLTEEVSGGNDNKLKLQFNTIGLEKANVIAIYEANTTFVGHYQEKERFNVIELWVNDNNASTPFNRGPNAIVISTTLFANTKLNGLMQQEKLMETPLWSAVEGNFEFIGPDHNEFASLEGATNEMDFAIMRRDISASDAMKVLDLLLTCIVNETLDETNQTVAEEFKLYTYVSTKFNETKAELLNLPGAPLRFIKLYSTYINSPQGEKPSTKDTVAWNTNTVWENMWGEGDISRLIKLPFAIYDDIMLYIDLNPTAQQILGAIMAVLDFIVMTILTWLLNSGLLWALIRLMLLILIFIMLAIEIYTTIPIYLAIGLSLLALASVAGVNSDVDVKYWADYSKDTMIGFLKFSFDAFDIQITSWIKWEYWSFFDLWWPTSEMEFSQGDITDMVTSEDSYPPALHCGFHNISDTQHLNRYEFLTTYTDWDNDEPSYVKLTLIAPNGTTRNFDMTAQEIWYGEDSYDLGIQYNVTVDFDEEFSSSYYYDGQWYYYFTTQDTESAVVQKPANYSFEIGPYFGDENIYLLYSSFRENSSDSNDPIVWTQDLLTFEVSAFDFNNTNITPDTVNLVLLWPNGTIQNYEMDEISSTTSINSNNNSIFLDGTSKEFSISLNFSESYNFLKDEIICYYFDALLTDGSHSFLYDFNEENNNNTWFYFIARHLPESGAYVLGYEVKEMVWPRTWDSWENYGIDFFGSTTNIDRVIQPISDEHVLRFKTWVINPEGTHEEIYNSTSYELKPVLELWKISDPTQSFQIDMEWAGYETDMEADMYFVELLGDGQYTYEWEELSDSDGGFGPGAWNFRIIVEDHHNNETIFKGVHKIWHTGSFQSMWQVMWGTPFVNTEDPMMNFFGVIRPILTTVGFIAAAGLSLAQKSPLDRIVAAITAAFDLGTKGMGLAAFFLNDDTGALLGLGMNSLMMAIMMLFVLEFGSLSRLFSGLMDKGGSLFNGPPRSEGIDKFGSATSKIVRILAILNMFLMIFANPGAGIPIALFLGLMFLYTKHSGKSGSSFTMTALTMLVSAFSFYASGAIEDGLGMTDFFEGNAIGILMNDIGNNIMFLPVQLITFLITGLSMGTMLNIIGFKQTENDKGEKTRFKTPVTKIFNTKGDPGKAFTASVRLYTYFAFGLAGASLAAFLVKTDFGHVAYNIFQEAFSDEQEEDYDSNENYGTGGS